VAKAAVTERPLLVRGPRSLLGRRSGEVGDHRAGTPGQVGPMRVSEPWTGGGRILREEEVSRTDRRRSGVSPGNRGTLGAQAHGTARERDPAAGRARVAATPRGDVGAVLERRGKRRLVGPSSGVEGVRKGLGRGARVSATGSPRKELDRRMATSCGDEPAPTCSSVRAQETGGRRSREDSEREGKGKRGRLR
jgi:hypothetical protein